MTCEHKFHYCYTLTQIMCMTRVTWRMWSTECRLSEWGLSSVCTRWGCIFVRLHNFAAQCSCGPMTWLKHIQILESVCIRCPSYCLILFSFLCSHLEWPSTDNGIADISLVSRSEHHCCLPLEDQALANHKQHSLYSLFLSHLHLQSAMSSENSAKLLSSVWITIRAAAQHTHMRINTSHNYAATTVGRTTYLL